MNEPYGAQEVSKTPKCQKAEHDMIFQAPPRGYASSDNGRVEGSDSQSG